MCFPLFADRHCLLVQDPQRDSLERIHNPLGLPRSFSLEPLMQILHRPNIESLRTDIRILVVVQADFLLFPFVAFPIWIREILGHLDCRPSFCLQVGLMSLYCSFLSLSYFISNRAIYFCLYSVRQFAVCVFCKNFQSAQCNPMGMNMPNAIYAKKRN